MNYKDIKGYEGFYMINEFGEIYSVPRKNHGGIILKQRYDKDGYRLITLWREGKPKTFKVHRLVLSTFKGDSKLECNHINGKKDDNNLSNLEWVTPSENSIHRFYVLGHKGCCKI